MNARAQDSSVEINLFDQNKGSVSDFSAILKNQKGEVVREKTIKKSPPMVFSNIAEGEYFIEISSIGFKPLNVNISVRKGQNTYNFVLEIEEIKVDVNVEESEQEKTFNNAISKNYTQEEISALPDSSDEIKKELQRKYGDDVVIRVNGFKSSQIPPKEQIAAIRVIRSSFDAEFHEIGSTIVDITTRAGVEKFMGFLQLRGDTYRLNARNAFSNEKLPQQNVNVMSFLIFPTYKKKTSLSLMLMGNQNVKTSSIIGSNPTEATEKEAASTRTNFLPALMLNQNLSKNHVLNVTFGLVRMKTTNLGVGGFNLSDSGYTNTMLGNLLQISETGVIGKKYSNQFRLEFGTSDNKNLPNNQTPKIQVLGSFTEGGASVNNRSKNYGLELADVFLFDYKNHLLKFGGEVHYEKLRSESSDNLNGTFTFYNLSDYLNNNPYSYTQRRTANSTELSQFQLAGFIQDDIRLLRNFQIGMGLRYEWQNNLNDFNNFSPRLSFTWSPDKEARLVIRSGVGIFYQWFETSTLSTIVSNDGRKGNDIIILNPSYPDPFLSGTTAQTLPPSIMQKADNLKNPTTFITKTGFNFRINSKYNLEGFYTFRRGLHQFRSRDVNAPINGIRANPNFGRVVQVESSGKTIENSLELKLEGKLNRGFSFDANYKIGKVLSDFEDIFSLPVDNYNLNREWAFANLDQRHRFNTRLLFPTWNSFTLNTTFRLESPRPYTITTGRDDNGDTVINDRPLGVTRNSERGEWFKQVDANLTWRTKIGKEDEKNPLSKMKNQLGFSLNVQNLFNQTNKQNFVGIQTSPYFRQATSAASARTIQFGLSLTF
ncbi:MAG: TonB-dependent receptor plug domain-containing protein [Pyrinomonadaceae bacterium]